MKDRCNECRYKMERHGIIEGEDVYYCDICGIYQTYPLEEEALLAAEKKNCGCGQDPCITFGAEVDCPPATQDVKINARNQKQAFDKFGYGPRNVKEPEDYWKKMAEFWEVSVEKAKEQNCGNCVAYDVSPRMKDCGVGENLGYCWMHNFQCQSARTCKTWAKGGPIKTDKESVEWQKRALGDVEKEAETFNSDYSIMIDGEEYDADYEDEGGYHGDDELDQYVEEYYGDDYNWVLLGQHQGYDIHEILPNFVVYDDDKNEHKGIAIVFEAETFNAELWKPSDAEFWEYDFINQQIETGDRDDERNHRVVGKNINTKDGELIVELHNDYQREGLMSWGDDEHPLFNKLVHREYGVETFNSYKVAPELSSYTVDELVASKAGPQGSAAYDEMVYDPIAQDRLSAESISIPHTVLLLGGIVAGFGFGFFLTKKLEPKTSEEGGA